MKLVLKIPIFNFCDANIRFARVKCVRKSYTTGEVLPITKKVRLINKRKFAAIVINKNAKIFMVYVVALKILPKLTGIVIYFF